MMRRRLFDVLILAGYVGFLVWILTPEWKREMWLRKFRQILEKERVQGGTNSLQSEENLSPEKRAILDQFLRELSSFRIPITNEGPPESPLA